MIDLKRDGKGNLKIATGLYLLIILDKFLCAISHLIYL